MRLGLWHVCVVLFLSDTFSYNGFLSSRMRRLCYFYTSYPRCTDTHDECQSCADTSTRADSNAYSTPAASNSNSHADTATDPDHDDRFQAPLFGANTGAAMGQVLLNGTANDGNGKVSLTGAPANMDLNLQFVRSLQRLRIQDRYVLQWQRSTLMQPAASSKIFTSRRQAYSSEYSRSNSRPAIFLSRPDTAITAPLTSTPRSREPRRYGTWIGMDSASVMTNSSAALSIFTAPR